jgi:PhnB protein
MVMPFINFNGNCKEAVEFYKAIFKSEIKSLYPYGDYIPDGVANPPDNLNEWIMHAEMEICGTNFWFADETEPVTCGSMLKLTANVPNAMTGQEYFDKLKDGGNITLPPTESFYSNFHAAVVDRFGVCWNIVSLESSGKPGEA